MAHKPARYMADDDSSIENTDDRLLLSSRWSRMAILVSLFIVPLAVSFVLLLSWRVDKELHYVSATATLRQQADRILLNLIEMGTTERAFSATRDHEHYQRFFHASEILNDVFHSAEAIIQDHFKWREWLGEVRNSAEERRKTLTRRIMSLQQTPGKQGAAVTTHDAAATIVPDRLTGLIATFIQTEEKELAARRQWLDFLRSGLTLSAIIAFISTFMLIFTITGRSRRDVHRLRAYQSLLHSENAVLEQRVKDRTAELEAARVHAEKERRRVELLLQDASHRIGNSLATVSSLLGLQLQRSTNAEVQAALASARDRIQTISTAHRRLRLGHDLETASIGEFLSAVVNDVQMGIPADRRERIQFKTHFEAWHLASRDVTTLGIILGELLTNAVKHAFPDSKNGKIDVSFGKLDRGKLGLVVEDNGIGLTDNNATSNEGLGKIVILQLCMQFGAKPRFETRRKGGTRVTIPLPNMITHEIDIAPIKKTGKMPTDIGVENISLPVRNKKRSYSKEKQSSA